MRHPFRNCRVLPAPRIPPRIPVLGLPGKAASAHRSQHRERPVRWHRHRALHSCHSSSRRSRRIPDRSRGRGIPASPRSRTRVRGQFPDNRGGAGDPDRPGSSQSRVRWYGRSPDKQDGPEFGPVLLSASVQGSKSCRGQLARSDLRELSAPSAPSGPLTLNVQRIHRATPRVAPTPASPAYPRQSRLRPQISCSEFYARFDFVDTSPPESGLRASRRRP